MNIARLAVPYNFTNLPMTVTGWESLNEHPVSAPPIIDIMNDRYRLRSVVLVEKATSNEGKSIIVGSSAMIISPVDDSADRYEETYFLYDPQSASDMFRDNGAYVKNGPITVIPHVQPLNMASNVESFEQRARTRGTIFIYQKKGNNGQQNPLFGSFN